MKKYLVLTVLFVLPIVAYLFFASGVTNFGKLPILTQQVETLWNTDNGPSLEGRITILGFLGHNVDENKGNAFNLNQKIYKRFSDFKDFQFIMVMPKGTEAQVTELKKELGQLSSVEKWHFIFGEEAQVKSVFESLETNVGLDDDLSTPYVFIIDKNRALRGRDDDSDEGVKYGFNATSVADLNNKMVDDVMIILAEYRMALKSNNAGRKK
ncbi:MAG: hypothetical protein AB3N16_03650 [Flavobacteriaceae bacterium]